MAMNYGYDDAPDQGDPMVYESPPVPVRPPSDVSGFGGDPAGDPVDAAFDTVGMEDEPSPYVDEQDYDVEGPSMSEAFNPEHMESDPVDAAFDSVGMEVEPSFENTLHMADGQVEDNVFDTVGTDAEPSFNNALSMANDQVEDNVFDTVGTDVDPSLDNALSMAHDQDQANSMNDPVASTFASAAAEVDSTPNDIYTRDSEEEDQSQAGGFDLDLDNDGMADVDSPSMDGLRDDVDRYRVSMEAERNAERMERVADRGMEYQGGVPPEPVYRARGGRGRIRY